MAGDRPVHPRKRLYDGDPANPPARAEGIFRLRSVDSTKNVFGTEITRAQRDESRRVLVELQPNECSLHDARIMHGSEPNTSNIRRCGYTMRFTSSAVKFNEGPFRWRTQCLLWRAGRDLGGNTYSDPSRSLS